MLSLYFIDVSLFCVVKVARPVAFVLTGGTSSAPVIVPVNFCFAKTNPGLFTTATTIKDSIAELNTIKFIFLLYSIISCLESSFIRIPYPTVKFCEYWLNNSSLFILFKRKLIGSRLLHLERGLLLLLFESVRFCQL